MATTVHLSEMSTAQQLSIFILGSTLFAWTIRSVWRLYFHPLSKYPGPTIAAISDIWYGYHWLSGRWPWAVEDALTKYGDVVRIAPNELVFVRPQALTDIYGAHDRNIELFPKTQINNHGNEERGGLVWEWDPVRHRKVSKQISPAFSGRALKAKEPTLHKHMDIFIQHMEAMSGDAVSLPTWLNWLFVDISGDVAYNREMNAMTDMKDPPYLDIIYGFNMFMTIIQVSWRFPLIAPLKYLFLLTQISRPHSDIRKHSRAQLERRIRRKGAVEHLDFFDHVIPEDREPPTDPKEMRHLEQVAAQLLVAGYEPPSVWMYGTIFHLLQEPDTLKALTEEIRTEFRNYRDINPAAAASLPFLTACLKEGLRIFPNTASIQGMPCISPGASIDGNWIPRGTVCQSSTFAQSRSPRNFRDPLHFRPQRWLPEDHPLYDTRFAKDDLKGFQPFSQGPRACVGKEVAWWQGRLLLAKVLWTFDLEMVPGQNVDLDKTLKVYGMYIKPEVRVKFISVLRGEE